MLNEYKFEIEQHLGMTEEIVEAVLESNGLGLRDCNAILPIVNQAVLIGGLNVFVALVLVLDWGWPYLVLGAVVFLGLAHVMPTYSGRKSKRAKFRKAYMNQIEEAAKREGRDRGIVRWTFNEAGYSYSSFDGAGEASWDEIRYLFRSPSWWVFRLRSSKRQAFFPEQMISKEAGDFILDKTQLAGGQIRCAG
jgi:hypothetical protein